MEHNNETIQNIELTNDIELQIYTDSSIIEGGGIIWDAAHVFTKFLSKSIHGFSDLFHVAMKNEHLNALELGCGTGFVGLSFIKLF
jgi:hypothetical protein